MPVPPDTQKAEQRAGWAPGDMVCFSRNGELVCGILSRCNPKTAEIQQNSGPLWQVSYERLEPDGLFTEADVLERRRLLAEISALARAFLARHQEQYPGPLEGWNFAWDAALRRGGVCNYQDRIIGLSAAYALVAAREEIEDTILHEIAHAIVGGHHNHDQTWRDMALKIGCSAEVCHTVEFAGLRWEGRCPNGCARIQRMRRNKLVCRTCDNRLRWHRIHDPLKMATPGLR